MKANRFSITLGILALVLTALAVVALALPVMAAPGAQEGENLPTPTPFPVEDVEYTLEVVGGEAQTLTFDFGEMDGFTLGETTVTSEYPRGMTFTIRPESANGEIEDAILFIRFMHDSGNRVAAEYDETAGAWIARPWATGEEQPAWTHFNFSWRVRDETGAFVDTEPQPMDYFDPTREWFRAESDHIIVYWFGFSEDDPDYVAKGVTEAMAATEPRRIAGFGRAISYKPLAVVYPTREALAETTGTGVERTRISGYTSSELGMSVQLLRDTTNPPGNDDCIWAPENPEEFWTMERRIGRVFGTTTHEVTHLYQYDVEGGAFGPEWFFEGQAEWFSIDPGEYDKRLRKLGELQDLPSLRTNVGSDLTQADGCYALSYDVGPSFLNFLMTNYGGVELHLQIIQLIRAQRTVYEAIEEAAGKPFFDLENEWRVYLGVEPFTLADVDPASALEELVDEPVAGEGETVTLPAMPPLVPLAEKPGPKSLSSGQCFAGTEVTILRAGSLDSVDYYEVDCMGMIGWVTRDALAGQ